MFFASQMVAGWTPLETIHMRRAWPSLSSLACFRCCCPSYRPRARTYRTAHGSRESHHSPLINESDWIKHISTICKNLLTSTNLCRTVASRLVNKRHTKIVIKSDWDFMFVFKVWTWEVVQNLNVNDANYKLDSHHQSRVSRCESIQTNESLLSIYLFCEIKCVWQCSSGWKQIVESVIDFINANVIQMCAGISSREEVHMITYVCHVLLFSLASLCLLLFYISQLSIATLSSSFSSREYFPNQQTTLKRECFFKLLT